MRISRSIPLVMALIGLAAACARERTTVTASGLRYEVLRAGEGPAAAAGQEVSIHETTTLVGGVVVYSSREGSPIRFRLGAGQVIAGVDEGVTGMRPGERRLLTVPPPLSRRTTYPPNTPPDATLLIDVELVAIHPG